MTSIMRFYMKLTPNGKYHIIYSKKSKTVCGKKYSEYLNSRIGNYCEILDTMLCKNCNKIFMNEKPIIQIKTLDSLYSEIIKFQPSIRKDWKEETPIYFSNALAGETGEICNLVKKLSGGGSKKMLKEQVLEKIKYEFGDVFAYLILLSENLGFTKEDFIKYSYEKHLIVKKRIMENE